MWKDWYLFEILNSQMMPVALFSTIGKNESKNSQVKKRLTRSKMEKFLFVFKVKFDGIWNCVFPTCLTNLFSNGWRDIVSNVIKVRDVLMVKFWPRFKWMCNEDVKNKIISVNTIFYFTCWFLLIINISICFNGKLIFIKKINLQTTTYRL